MSSDHQQTDLHVQALVRERIKDWGQGLCKSLSKKLVELTGDKSSLEGRRQSSTGIETLLVGSLRQCACAFKLSLCLP